MPTKYYKRKLNKKPTDSKQGQWSDRQKFEAVTVYMMVGKWPLVADATKIPIDTLKKWKQADWWKEYESEIRRAKNLELGGKLQTIVNKASEVVLDRLEYGDFQYDPKSGKFIRKPINAKVAGDIMVKAIDKDLLIQKIDETPKENAESIMDRLNHIADKLLQASGKKKKSEVIDVSPIEQSDFDGSRLVGFEASSGSSDATAGEPASASASPTPESGS